jgi:hypothetical protein
MICFLKITSVTIYKIIHISKTVLIFSYFQGSNFIPQLESKKLINLDVPNLYNSSNNNLAASSVLYENFILVPLENLKNKYINFSISSLGSLVPKTLSP